MDPSDTFLNLLEDDWEARMRFDPLFATSTGNHCFDHLLPRVRQADYDGWYDRLLSFRARLHEIDCSQLGPNGRLNYDVYSHFLESEIVLHSYHPYRMPISKVSGFHIYFPDLPQQMPFDTIEAYENYISRLEAFRQYMDDHMEVMCTGLENGQVPARVTLEGIREQITAQIVEDPTKSPLYQPFEGFPESISGEERVRLAEKGKAAIQGTVVPAYQVFLRFFNEDYFPASRETIAAVELPQGQEYYRAAIRYFTSLDLTPEAIHNTGLLEVSRIKDEMEEVIHQAGFQGDFLAFVEFLRTDPRFYVDTPEALLEKTALVLKRMDGELPRLFKTLPKLPYGIRPIPDYAAPQSHAAYYFPGAGDGSRAGYYCVNTYELKSRPLYEIEALSLHEAVPGHHLQIALQQELDLLPFRRFLSATAFVEGWALYAEKLGLEAGFYQDLYSNFGRLSYEMWRACRLVVDTGMHSLGWTRQQAIDFMLANTSSTLLNVTNEVDRYIAWPGQALAYKIGELKMVELRRRVQETLGKRFDLREFHDVILKGGALPLSILDDVVNQYIESHQSKAN